MAEQKLIVTEIERSAIHDGPGLRTVVFLQGCPLSCYWCCNPETQSVRPVLLHDRNRCVGCGACTAVCPNAAVTIENGKAAVDRELCRACGACAAICPLGANSLSGKEMTVAEVLAVVARDRAYFDATGGGLTLSGGEPLLQSAAPELLKQAKAAGISTAVETTACLSYEKLEAALPYIDRFIMLTLLLSFASAGQTIVLIGGGMDFGVGAVMSSAAILTTSIMKQQDGHFIEVFVIAMLMGAAVGLLNGVCAVKIGLPAMIVTMAVSNVVSRLQYVLTQGSPLGYASPSFVASVSKRLFGLQFLPTIVLYALVIFPLVYFILNRSRFGKQVYLVGNNPVAARLNGVNVHKVQILTYVISGLFSAFAGMLGAAYMTSARCQMFDEYAYNSLIAVIIGGTTLSGGVGTYTGSIAGSLVMILLSNMLTTVGMAQPVRNICMGAVLILLLALYNREKNVRQ